MHSIRTRLITVTVAAVLASVLAFAALAYKTVGDESRRYSTEEMNLLSQNVQQSLDEYLGSVRQSVEMVAHYATDQLDPVVLVECGVAGSAAGQSRTRGQVARLDAYLAQHSADVQEAFSSVANHTSGVVTYYYCIATDVSENQHGFFWSRVGETGFVEQAPLDARDLDPEDIEHTTWYYTPIQRGRPSWVGPYKAHYLGERWTVSYLIPIYKAGSLIGVMGMDILFETMQEKVDAVKIYDTGYACLMSDDGTVLAHPEWEIGEKHVGDEAVRDQILARDNSGDEVVHYRDEAGREKQLAFSTLSSGMKLVVSAPAEEINASWRGLMTRIILMALGIIAAFAVITALIVHRLTKPLKQLAGAADRFSAGDYDVELDYHGNNEVGRLTASFREMQKHMKLYISDLNSKAYSDALTHVKNKAAYDISAARLEQSIHGGIEGDIKPAFGLIMFDCNELKEINDQFGHERGDIYLQTACRMICRVFAHSPVFRIGGDEFVVLVTGQDYENRDALLREFEEAAEAANRETENPWEKISLAKGVAVFDPDSDTDMGQILDRADRQMYEEKRKHKQELGIK